MNFDVQDKYLDYVLVPCGLLVLGVYHCWLLISIRRHPRRFVIGLNRMSRHRWVYHMMSDSKNGILAIQTLRNNLMASTLLATIAITLSSLISAVVSNSSSPTKPSVTGYIHTFKYFSILVCFLAAFLCNMQCIRYYAHVSFLINAPPLDEGRDEYIEYVAQKLNRGSLFWSLGLRAFYFSFPLLLWIFGAVAMFGCSSVMVMLLYFLDTANSASRNLQNGEVLHKEEANNRDVEVGGESRRTTPAGDSSLYCSLLESTKN